MATEERITAADTAAPARRAAIAREANRRERNTRMGPGGSDIVDSAVVPSSLAACSPKPEDVTLAFRFLHRRVSDTDTRIELLHLILGE